MRALIMGPEEKADIARVMAYAQEPEHFYSLGDSVPGDNPAHVAHVPDGFRCVFTHTRHGGKLWRHLTISVPGDNYPSPEACVMLAREFGFTDSAPETSLDLTARAQDWLVAMKENEHCIMLAQPMG